MRIGFNHLTQICPRQFGSNYSKSSQRKDEFVHSKSLTEELRDVGVCKYYAKRLEEKLDWSTILRLIEIKKVLQDADAFKTLDYLDGEWGRAIVNEISKLHKGNPDGFDSIQCVPVSFQNGDTEVQIEAKRDNITLVKHIDSNKNVTTETSEEFPDGRILSRIKGSDGTFETMYDGDNILYQIEISNDKIIYTKASDILPGTFDTTLYELKDYDEDTDIINEIKNGTLKGGRKLSYAKENKDGTIVYDENFAGIKRHYVKDGDNFSYSFKTPFLCIEREFERISDNKTRTTLNEKEYFTEFDDDTKTVTVTESGNVVKIIDMKSKTLDRIMFNSAKKLPADTLLNIDKYVKHWLKAYPASAIPDEGKIFTYSGQPPETLHELGHLMGQGLSEDEALKKIYNKEIRNFNSYYTKQSGKECIKYFSLRGGNCYTNNGLDELIAEANMLFTTYGSADTDKNLRSRAQILVQNFPLTLSYIAHKLGYT